ncbi:MAG: molybdopterin-dependent oxidoreductase [Streptosporangiales bacterium]|nr:molybdopterin-dependent oxidoreductase [Streptosporangiales bacterium]
MAGNRTSEAAGRERLPQKRLPPGQYVSHEWPVLHYGPVPKFDPDTWDLQVFGATASGQEHRWGWEDFSALRRRVLVADLHCVTKFSVLDNEWEGVPASVLLELAPPEPGVTHVMVWAEYGYSANMRLSDFAADHTLFAIHRNGERLAPEHGYPVRLVVPHLYAWKSVKWARGVEYAVGEPRGFWEERGYHKIADPWREQRYAYQELTGEDT